MRILIVGLGSMGKRRARLAAGLGHSAAGVDSAPARREEAAGLGITAYASIEEALAAEAFGAAFVCTAPLSHAAIIGQLLDAGLSVFTELNLVADGYDELAAKAKAKNVTLFMSSTMLYRGETQHIRHRVLEFSHPMRYIYHIGQYLPDWHPWENYKDFFVGDARTGGVREIFAIDLPWLVDTFGNAVPLCVEKESLSTLDIAYPDTVFATLKHENGTVGFLAVDVVSPKAVRNFEAFGEGLHLFWEGSPASLFEYDAAAKEKRQVEVYKNAEQDARYSDNIVENAYVDEMANFFDVLAGQAQPRWSLEKDKRVLELIDAMEAF